MGNDAKVYVDVLVAFDAEGNMTPKVIKWETGEKFVIDKVGNITAHAAARAGGVGDRYEIRVNGKVSFLFFERLPALSGRKTGRWFVERRQDAY